MRLVLGADTCRNLEAALRREWLETNGIGGYASSTLCGCHTRKYHGLLVAALADPPGRFVLVSGVDESAVCRGAECELSTHRYPGAFHPHGYRTLESFETGSGARFAHRIGAARLVRTVRMLPGRNVTLVRYELQDAAGPVLLRLRPRLAFRGFHELAARNDSFDVRTRPLPDGFRIRPYETLPELAVRASPAPRFQAQPDWYYRAEYGVEQERGFPCREDLLVPGLLEVELTPDRPVVLALAADPLPGTPDEAWAAAAPGAPDADGPGNPDSPRAALAWLREAGGAFRIRRPDGRPAILAGYHWFEDWGRDTMISLPGLAFCSGHAEFGREVLAAYAAHARDGLIPNYFSPDGRHNAYNSVDASLWFFWSVQQMLLRDPGARDFIRAELWDAMTGIFAAYMAGTHHGIGMRPDGLLAAGAPDTQLTWMDAMVHGRPVTPRHGLAVEINALWYNAMCLLQRLATGFGVASPLPDDLPARTRRAFQERFPPSACGLPDFVSNLQQNRAVRPNQIFAASLPFSPLREDALGAVVDTVRGQLLTPYGLRTLSPDDAHYRGRYEGDGPARDGAYHQGTVWPWLLGHYVDAALRAAEEPEHTRRELLEQLAPLWTAHLTDAGVGFLSEVFDGNPPHRPNGCIAQAWSVAETIRLLDTLTDTGAA